MQYQITTFAAAGLTPSGTIQRELSRQTCRHLSPERAFDVNPNFHRNLSMPRDTIRSLRILTDEKSQLDRSDAFAWHAGSVGVVLYHCSTWHTHQRCYVRVTSAASDMKSASVRGEVKLRGDLVAHGMYQNSLRNS